MDGDWVQCASAAQPLKHLFEDDVLEHWRNHCGGYRVPRGDESGGTVHAKERTQRSGIRAEFLRTIPGSDCADVAVATRRARFVGHVGLQASIATNSPALV